MPVACAGQHAIERSARRRLTRSLGHGTVPPSPAGRSPGPHPGGRRCVDGAARGEACRARSFVGAARPLDQLAGDLGRDHPLPVRDAADRVADLLVRGALDHVAGAPAMIASVTSSCSAETVSTSTRLSGASRSQLPGRLDARDPGHLQVHHHHVRLMLLDDLEPAFAVGRLRRPARTPGSAASRPLSFSRTTSLSSTTSTRSLSGRSSAPLPIIGGKAHSI